MQLESINNALEIPVEDSATPIKVEEARYIYNFLKEKKITETMEIGFAYGRSTSHIIAATNSKHYTIDPFQENYQFLGLKNIEKLGFNDKLFHYNDFSHNVLPKLMRENQKFDFIFIDGDHKFDGIFIDFYYSDFIINNGGYLLFHDTWMRSTQLVLAFIKKNRKDYKFIKTPLRNLVLIQKIGADNRNGMHFKGFYNFKSLLRNKVIMWMSEGKDSFARKTMLKLKNVLFRNSSNEIF